MKPIRWGILGDAGIAKKAIIPAIQRADNATVTGIASQKGVSKETVEQFGIPKTYSSYYQLLEDREIDAVYIPLPNALHKQWVIEAARYKKHILCEKPAALTSADVEEMKTVCEAENVYFMEAFMYQFHPQHLRVQELIASGEIGTVKQMNAVFTYELNLNQENIRLNQQLGGGSLYDVGCYCIHASRFILQEEPSSVYCEANIDPIKNVDVTVNGILSFPDNIMATFRCSFEQASENSYEVIGTKGKIIVPHAFRPDKRDGVGEILILANEERIEKLQGDQYRAQIEHFSNAILRQTELSYRPQNTLQNMWVIDACFSSMLQKRRVTINRSIKI